MHPHRLPLAGRAQERGCGTPKHKRCSGAGLPVPPLSTNHPPAFQFCQVLHAGDREETARAQMGGRRKTKRRSTGWLCPRWQDRGVTSRWAPGMPGVCSLLSSSGSLQLFRGCVPKPVPLAGTTEAADGEEVWWGLAYLAVAQTWPYSLPSDRSLCCFAGARPPGCSFQHRWRRRCEWQGWETKDSFYWRLLPSKQGATQGSAAAGWVGVPWMSASAAHLSSGDFNGPSLPVCSLCHLCR